ncbi:MAG: hypothetical protein AAGC56_10410 [Pseudomonadota bacterium]
MAFYSYTLMTAVKSVAAAVLAGAVFALSAPASAQNGPGDRTIVLDSLTVPEFAELFQSAGFATAVQVGPNNFPMIEVTAPGGGTFYVFARKCAEAGEARCDTFELVAYFMATGVTFSAVNDLHTRSVVRSTIMLLDQTRGVVSTKLLMSGGVSPNNIGHHVGVFLSDSDKVISAIAPGVKATVSFEKPASGLARPAQGALHADLDDPVLNAVGLNAPGFSGRVFEAAMADR